MARRKATCYLCSWERTGYENRQESNEAILKHLRRKHGIKNPLIENRD